MLTSLRQAIADALTWAAKKIAPDGRGGPGPVIRN